MVPSESKSSWILSGLCPGWVISIQDEHKTAPIILVWHHGLEQDEDSLLPGLLSWQLPPAITPPVEKTELSCEKAPPLLVFGKRKAFLYQLSSQPVQKPEFASNFSKLDMSLWFLFAGVWDKAKHTHDSQKNTPSPLCKWEPFMRELIGTSSPKSVLLLNFLSWLKAQLSLIGFSQKLSKCLQHLPSLPFPTAFNFPGQWFLPP